MPLPEVLAELAALGCVVTVTNGAPSVTPPKNKADAARFADLMPLLKLHRTELVAAFAEPVVCEVCGRDVTDPEDRERLADPLFCDRGGAAACRDRKGVVTQDAV